MRITPNLSLISLFLATQSAIAQASGAGSLRYTVSFQSERCRLAPTAGGPATKICPATHIVTFQNTGDAPIEAKIFCGNRGDHFRLQGSFRLDARKSRSQSIAEYDYPTHRVGCFVVTDRGRATLF